MRVFSSRWLARIFFSTSLFLTLFAQHMLAQVPEGFQFDLGFLEAPERSQFNLAPFSRPDSGWSYNFITGGHLYGAHGNNHAIYPSSSLLANSGAINGARPSAIIATGDVVRSSKDEAALKGWKEAGSLFKQPIYNAPGNHDLDDPAAYKKAFGKLQYSFFIRDDFFVLLNTEELLKDDPSQLKNFVQKQQDRVKNRPRPVRHLFVFSHRMLAPLCDPSLEAMDGFANESFMDKADHDQACKVFNAVAEIPHEGEWWWFSGDVGTHWSVPGIYGESTVGNCHVLATGMGDTDQDLLAKITVGFDGTISLASLPLYPTQDGPDLKTLTVEHWTAIKAAAPPTADNQGSITAVLKKKSFWAGAIAGGTIAALIVLLLVRLSKKKSF